MRLVTLVRCVKSHRAEGKMDMILGGLKDFQCQKWVYSHAKDEETNLGTSACWEPLILGKSFDQNNNLNSISPLKAVNNAIMMASFLYSGL